MANRYLRGTFVRNAWDFYELGAAFATGNYFAPIGTIGFLFRNNGIGQSYLDVYRAEASVGSPSEFSWSVLTPGQAFTAIEPFQYFNSPVQLDLAGPPGDMIVYTNAAGYFVPALRARNELIQYDFIELANGGPFLTLPPLYGLAVDFTFTAATWMTFTIWYQSLTDHTPPAM